MLATYYIQESINQTTNSKSQITNSKLQTIYKLQYTNSKF